MRSVSLAVVLPVLLAGVALFIVAANDERGLVSSLGVNPVAVVSEMSAGQESCQTPIPVTDGFARVQFQVGTYRRPGPQLSVTIRDADSDSLLRRGHLAAGYPDISKPVVLVGDVQAGRRISLCIKNVGKRPAALFGSGGDPAPASGLTLDGRPGAGDLTASFYEADRSSAFNEVPEMFRRASLFRPSWVGPWTFWALAASLMVAVPLLLLGALRGSLTGPREDGAGG